MLLASKSVDPVDLERKKKLDEEKRRKGKT